MPLLAKERKARWIGTGTWSDSGIDPNRLITYPRCTSSPFNCSVRTSYGTNQIVAVKDLYYSWTTSGGSSCSGYVSCSCYGNCGSSVDNRNCHSGNSACGIGCACYTGVGSNTTGGTDCNSGSSFYSSYGNCSMNGCWYGTCNGNKYDGWCTRTMCESYCICAWGNKNCSCHSDSGYTTGTWVTNPSVSHCRNCPSDDNNDCHCNSGNG